MTTLRCGAESWFLYDPFDHPEYCFLKWVNLRRRSAKRLVGQMFASDDFLFKEGVIPLPGNRAAVEFPETWNVMF